MGAPTCKVDDFVAGLFDSSGKKNEAAPPAWLGVTDNRRRMPMPSSHSEWSMSEHIAARGRWRSLKYTSSGKPMVCFTSGMWVPCTGNFGMRSRFELRGGGANVDCLAHAFQPALHALPTFRIAARSLWQAFCHRVPQTLFFWNLR